MSNTAVYSTAMLAESKAKPYNSMNGKLSQPLLQALEKKGYGYMTPVQEKVLTQLPNFKSDCLVRAKTGTGKTIAFLLPSLHSVLASRNGRVGDVRILIVSPTRELAMQIKAECDMLTSELRPAIECHTAFGGTKKDQNLKAFLNGRPTVLVATPGRLNDYLSDQYVAEKFSNLHTLILDEADTMLEAGFLPAITQILRSLPPKTNGWQGMCFSATMPPNIKPVLSKVLRADHAEISTVDLNETPTHELVDQYSVIIPTISSTFSSLAALIAQERQRKPDALKAIIFGTTANGVGLMCDLFKNLLGNEIKVYELHSRLSQPARTRTTEDFKNTASGLMFASDVIGRGMDFPNVDLVIQVGLPSNGEQYVHRVGRTARAGNNGRAVIMLTDREKYFLAVNRHLPIKPYILDISSTAAQATPAVEQAFSGVEESAKQKAYQAYLGFNKSFCKNLRIDNTGLVTLANEYAGAMGCPEPPMIDKSVVGKMGLRGTHGLNVGVVQRAPGGGRGQGGGGAPRGGGQRKPAQSGGAPNGGASNGGPRPNGSAGSKRGGRQGGGRNKQPA
ncbi:hypothetical protein LTR56_002292 [Elasticomyces elasticus]|nr:hypothetical protein LTR56_002292 [Elasticomyces elasticus]KAK3665857.1 hypothetical protein LTR22_003175 [Elasticomyces elasticus]KAK4929329.1 hypothetical protein LTR49_003932 [Elasticomyces elasticus]KAK5764618.1 hypothetical protein LTS12_005118 [Elasticomyces elasticus]